MDFTVEHSFDATPDDVAAVLLDEAFQDSLADVGALAERKVLSQEKAEAGRVVRKVHCVLAVDIGGAARKLMGDGDPSWVEEATWHPAERRWDWVIHPEVAAHLLTADGTIDILADGDHALRRVSGRIKVHVPLYGGRVEGWIKDGIEAAYDEEASRIEQWLIR